MAEFQEVIQQKNRMCQSTKCCKCDIYRLCNEDLSKCQRLIYNNPKKAEEVIMSWAAKHPKPVYPTWYEYLSDYYRAAFGDMSVISKQPIPADLAQKLGLQPKEK